MGHSKLTSLRSLFAAIGPHQVRLITSSYKGRGPHMLLDSMADVHLGPAVIVRDLVAPLEVGQSVTVQAFRTQKMPAEDFVAIAIKFDGKTVRLRDENLRPTWAGGRGQFFSRYQSSPELPRWPQRRQAYGRGYGMGYGRGYRAGFGRGIGRGYGRGWSSGVGSRGTKLGLKPPEILVGGSLG